MISCLPRVQLLIDRGRYKEAEALLREALAKDPDDPRLYIHLSQTLRLLERPKEAEETARRAVGLEPDSGFAHEVLAWALIDSQKLKEAESAIEAANALDGDDADRRALLSRIELDRGKYASSLTHAESGLAMEPDHDLCRYFRGIVLGKLGRHEEADAATIDLLRDNPDDTYNHSARGWAMLERGRTEDAKMHFREALQIDPNNEGARLGLARSLQHRHPTLGWLLRLLTWTDKIPWSIQLLAVAGAVIFLPRLIQGRDQPFPAVLAVQVLRIACMLLLYATLVSRPLFDMLLALSKEGKLALSNREMTALRWSALPLVSGLAFTGLWLSKGGKGVPFEGIAFISATALLYGALTCGQSWVRRRLLGIASLATVIAVWVGIGPFFIMKPFTERLMEVAAKTSREERSKDDEAVQKILAEVEKVIRVRNWAFLYPTLLIYLIASFSDSLVTALHRHSPDESD